MADLWAVFRSKVSPTSIIVLAAVVASTLFYVNSRY